MQAVARAVLTKYPGTRVHYFGAEQFINEVIESIHARTMSEFRRRYRNDVDLFLVDDVHFLEGKEMTQERSEEHTSELQSQSNLVCRLLLEKTKTPSAPTLAQDHLTIQ